MNKLFFILIFSQIATAFHNQTLVKAIAQSDYETVAKELQRNPIEWQDKDYYLQIADQVILSNLCWKSNHHTHPEIGKDFFKGIGYSLATILSTLFTFGGTAAVIDAAEEGESLKIKAPLSLFFAGLSSYLGYKAIQKFIVAWNKPDERLTNAFLIKEMIKHSLTANYQASYSTAVGSSALTYNIAVNSQAADYNIQATDYNIVGGYSTAIGTEALTLECND